MEDGSGIGSWDPRRGGYWRAVEAPGHGNLPNGFCGVETGANHLYFEFFFYSLNLLWSWQWKILETGAISSYFNHTEVMGPISVTKASAASSGLQWPPCRVPHGPILLLFFLPFYLSLSSHGWVELERPWRCFEGLCRPLAASAGHLRHLLPLPLLSFPPLWSAFRIERPNCTNGPLVWFGTSRTAQFGMVPCSLD